MDKCDFSGTYSQLKTHLKAEHPGFAPTKLDPWKQEIWEQLERETEYIEMNNAHQRWEAEQRFLASSLHQLPYRHPIIDLNFDAFMHDLFIGASIDSRARSQASAPSFPAHMPRLDFHARPVFPRWAP